MNSLAYFALAGCMLSAALGAVIVCVLVSGCGLAWDDGQPEDNRRRSRVTRVGHAAAGLSFFFAALFALVALAGASSDLPARLQMLRPAVTGIAVTLSRISDVAERLRSRVDHWTVRPAAVETAQTRLDTHGGSRERLDRGMDHETRPASSPQVVRMERLEMLEPPRQLAPSPSGQPSTGNAGTEVSRRLAEPSPSSAALASARSAPRPRPEIRDTSINTVRVEPSVPTVTPAPPRVEPVQPVTPDIGVGPADKPRVDSRDDAPRIDKAGQGADKTDHGDRGELARDAIDDPVKPVRDADDRRERAMDRSKSDDRDKPGKQAVTSGRRDRMEASTRADDRTERAWRDRVERADRIERAERVERAERIDRPERVERAERIERAERVERPERIERRERIDRPERIERPEKVERVERVERPARVERAERPERRERIERIERGGRR